MHEIQGEGRVKGATVKIAIAGEFGQGVLLRACEEAAMLPTALVEEYEQVYRASDTSLAEFGIARWDLLIVEPKKRAQTGEFVLARRGDRVFVGRWWAKHGRRDVVGSDGVTVIVGDATVVGSINLIVRMS